MSLGYLLAYPEAPPTKGVIVRAVNIPLPATYTAGGFTVNFTGGKILGAVLTSSFVAGYGAKIVEITSNSIKIMLYHFDYPATAAGPAVEVPDGTSLPSDTLTVLLFIAST